MIASTLLQDSVSKFLTNVAKYTGIPFCLTDHDRAEIVRTPVDEHSPYGNEVGYDTERKIRLRDGTVWYLYTLDQPEPGTELLREQVLDFTAEVVFFIINNEEEMQNLTNELLERYQELHVLYDVINDVSTVLDEDGICHAVLRKAMQTLDVRFGAVAFMKDTSHVGKWCVEGQADHLSEEKLIGYVQQVCASNSHLIIDQIDNPAGGSCAALPALLAVSVTANRMPIGSMIVSSKRHGGNFTTGDRISLTALAGYLGIAFNSARLIKEAHEAEALRREFDYARKIQESLLPKRLPDISTLDIAARCLPAADVGGDLFTFFELATNEWTFGVADVAGHGLGAAFILASLRSILRSECRRGTALETIMHRTNNTLCEDTEESELFATLFMASYDNSTRMLRSVNAGHPPGVMWRARTKSLVTLDSGGMAIGLFRDESYEYHEVMLEPGDILLMYTDGINETRNTNNEFYGTERLHSFLRRHASADANTLLRTMLDDIAAYRGAIQQNDDITIVIAKAR
jgi:serine phosphatase RsbU (regulator of sigma subunit)